MASARVGSPICWCQCLIGHWLVSTVAAEPLYKRSLSIWEKALGPEHPNVGETLNNLAVLYSTQGTYDKAEPLYKRSLAIREKALGLEHSHVDTSLNNLAALYEAQGKYAEAGKLEARAKAIQTKHTRENPAK